jgi:intracellular sulfur oxidation DsrE/DsrF family protein
MPPMLGPTCDNAGMFRRTFLAAASGVAAILAPGAAAAATQTTATRPEPKRHAQDDWLDQAPTGHRAVFDCWMSDTAGETIGFAGNWLRVNKDQYGLADGDLAVVIVVRHGSAPFAFSEALWSKYGKILAANMSANDPVAHPIPTTNVHAERLKGLAKQGMRLAVCSLSTRRYAGAIAKETGQDPDAVYKEITGNPVGPATFVPAGVVTVTRAQERGYALVSIG